jgi:DinB family protein
MSVFSNSFKDSAEDRAQYAPAILGLLGAQDPMIVLRATPAAAARAVTGLTAAQVQTPECPGKWSIAQVLRHLADSEVVWGWRMRLILAQDRPSITGYDQDRWAERLHYADADPADSLDTLRVLRRDDLRLIERATPGDLQRVGVHSERGEESAGYMVRLYAGHDLLHLRQIDRIKQAIA